MRMLMTILIFLGDGADHHATVALINRVLGKISSWGRSWSSGTSSVARQDTGHAGL